MCDLEFEVGDVQGLGVPFVVLSLIVVHACDIKSMKAAEYIGSRTEGQWVAEPLLVTDCAETSAWSAPFEELAKLQRGHPHDQLAGDAVWHQRQHRESMVHIALTPLQPLSASWSQSCGLVG